MELVIREKSQRHTEDRGDGALVVSVTVVAYL